MQNPKPLPENRENEIQTINYSRGGSDVSDVVNFYSLSSSDFELDKGILATGLDCSIDTKESCIDEQSIVVDESLLKEPFIGVSLGTVSIFLFKIVAFFLHYLNLINKENLNYIF